MKKNLRYFMTLLLMMVASVGWAQEDPNWSYTVVNGDGEKLDTENKTFTVDESHVWNYAATTVAVGAPTVTIASYSKTYGILFGKSGSIYFNPVILSTEAFYDKAVTKVRLHVKHNGKKVGTLTVTQGDIEIGTATTANTSDWIDVVCSETHKGSGGTLSIKYEVDQALYINKIEVWYEDGSSTAPYITANNVNIDYDATSGEIGYTITNPVTGTSLTADVPEGSWLTLGTVSETSIPFTCDPNTDVERTATVTLTYGSIKKDVTVTQAAKPVVYTTIPAIFGAAESTEKEVKVTFNNWVVSGVNGNQVFVTDGTNGFIIYEKEHGFEVGKTLSGTASCNLVLFHGSAELTGLTKESAGLTVGENGSITPVPTTIDALGAVNTGSVVTLSNLTYNGTALTDGTNTITLYKSLHEPASDLVIGKHYNITGVFHLYDTVKRILPRSDEDIVELSVPSITADDVNLAYDANSGEIKYTINNPVEGGVLTASPSADWITDVTVVADNSKVTFNCAANEGDSDRSATITLSYPGADDKEVTVTQAHLLTGDSYELFSGDLVEGDYIIYYNGKAMNTTVTKDRLQYEEVAPVENVITTNNAAIVWHIAKSGDYWTIYNAAADSYAASTGANNKAQMLADGTDDKSLWTVSGTEAYDFVNKQNTTNEVNAYLRNNGTYGFACYAEGTGGALSLYKKVVHIKTATSGYTTLVSGEALDIAKLEGLTAYYVTADGVSTEKVTLTKVTAAVPAETPLIFKGAGSTDYYIPIATGKTTPLEGNKLAGYYNRSTELPANSAYILSGGEFHPTNAGTFPAGKAYLNVSAVNAKALTISFAETNGINNVNVENNTNEKIFNLAGQQMKSAVKGVYIKNGRKYVK